MDTLQTFAARWSHKQFGNTDPLVTLKVLKREVWELEEVLEGGDFTEQCEEIADVAIALMVLASEVGCDLEDQVITKLIVNATRRWVKNPDGTWSHEKPAQNPFGHLISPDVPEDHILIN